MAKLHHPTAQSSGDPEVNYPPLAVPVLLNGVSVVAARGEAEPGSRDV